MSKRMLGSSTRGFVKLWEPVHHRNDLEIFDASVETGHTTRMLLRMGPKVTCSNLEEERHPEIPEDAEYRGGVDLNQPLPFADDTFDAANLQDVIEHLENPAQTIREFLRIVKPGGLFVFSTPNTLNATSRLRFFLTGFAEGRKHPISYAKPPGEAGNVYITNIVQLHYLLAQYGATIERMEVGLYHWHAAVLGVLFYPLFLAGACAATRGVRRRSMLPKKRREGVPDQELARLQARQRKVNRRLRRIILSKPVIFGRNLMIRARNGGADPFDA
jgi:SAM-dependent methyltransferase